MGEELFSEPEICSVYWDEQIEAVVLEWEGTLIGNMYREYMDRTLDEIVDRQASKLLVDRREQGPMSADDREWTVEDWDLRATDAGLEFLAIVYPADRSAKATVDMAARESPHLELERFFTDDFAEARNWLRMY